MPYVRYESAVPNAGGAHPGIFGLANGLARSGALSAADWAWWRASNDWYDAAYVTPPRSTRRCSTGVGIQG
jgi:hypothetical protein